MSLILDGTAGLFGNVTGGDISGNIIGLNGNLLPVTATGSTTARSLANRFADVVNVKDFGAVGDGVADDTAAIQAAINAGANIYFPNGIYIVSDNDSDTVAIKITKNNINLFGAGINSTILKLKANQNAHTISTDGFNFIQISDISIDGNRSNQTGSGHGIRVASCNSLHINNLEIKETAGYGIGLQSGTLKNIFISNVEIKNTSLDGIDFKNTNNNNSNLILDNISISNYGLNTSFSNQTGMDIRGPATITNIHVSSMPNDGVGIRFRNGETSDPTGLGGHNSSLSNFIIYGSNGVSQIGISIISRDVTISNGTVDKVLFGVECAGERNLINNVSILNTTSSGIIFNYVDSIINGSYSTASNCKMNNCIEAIQIEGNNNIIQSCQMLNCTTRTIQIDVGANNNIISSNQFLGGVLGVLDNGTNSIFTNNFGLDLQQPPLRYGDRGTVIISSGTINISKNRHTVDTEGSAPTDDLDTINGATYDGQILIISSVNSSRDITVKDGTGNIQLSTDFVLITNRNHLMLVWDDVYGAWFELSRSIN